MTRCARRDRVFYVEEPVRGERDQVHVSHDGGVAVLVPMLSARTDEDPERCLARLLTGFLAAHGVHRFILWYYTPMALGFTRHLRPVATVYDCMDELSAFAGAPPLLRERELELFARADLVLTGGHSLYEAKRDRHRNVHAFPSSVDVPHFGQARRALADPADQASIPHPRLGFFGVIDERMDLALLSAVAAARRDWHLVLVGPTAKVDPALLPRRPNIHYLGKKGYAALPSYLAGWDVALLPFARNEATRFISPTKTPEYLAAAKPVVSTSIRDVVRPYGERGLVRIADEPVAFVAAVEAALREDAEPRIAAADAFLAHMSWDVTWSRMVTLVRAATARQR
ncbi:MAG TPA: glycosyltransferase [Vicinamibacterales bacterium]|nr:glycosyltransferase [Vicinamibacterales bacterium]